MTQQALRLMQLYQANERSSGRYDPKSGKMHTEYAGLGEAEWDRHLNGVQGVGAVPIRDDDTCLWGAIDIDNHGQNDDIPIAPVDEKISLFKIPAIACRSKSGGIHVYAFFDKPRPASRVRATLARWAALLDFPKAEIFPKQARLAGEPGKKQLGNWINLPYMGGDGTIRYAIYSGRRLTTEEFISTCESIRITDASLALNIQSSHPQAPPCVQRMMTEGVAEGKRNEAMYNAVVYFRRAYPSEIENFAQAFNAESLSKPLGKVEFTRTVSSASRADYSYRCNEDPIRSLCDRATCLKRQFGITPTESTQVEEISGLPTFTNLVKYTSEPVRWSIEMDGIRVNYITTENLLHWPEMKKAIAEQLLRIVPTIKNGEWERLLQPLMANCRLVEVETTASPHGAAREHLKEFGQKVRVANGVATMKDREAILRGLPVKIEMEDGEFMAFRYTDFVSYLKRTKNEDIKGPNLYLALESMGVEKKRMRVGDKVIDCLWVPWKNITKDQPDPIQIPRSEI